MGSSEVTCSLITKLQVYRAGVAVEALWMPRHRRGAAESISARWASLPDAQIQHRVLNSYFLPVALWA